MPMFELIVPHKTTLKQFGALSQKNRPADEKPGAKLLVEQTWPNTFLDFFDPMLRQMLYEKAKGSVAAQKGLEGVAAVSDTPSLTDLGVKLASIRWHHELTGYQFELVRGAGLSKANRLTLTDCTMYDLLVTLKDGGSVIAKYYIDTGGCPDLAWHTFAALKSREFEMTATPPDPAMAQQQRAIDEPVKPEGKVTPLRKPGASERAAVAKVKGGKAATPTGKGASKPKASAAEKKPDGWPFPNGKADSEAPPQGVTVEQSQPGTRTARGRDKTAAALAAGAAAAGDSAETTKH